jgi:hypothetical protein
VTSSVVKPEFFKDIYSRIENGTEKWNALKAPTGVIY